MASRTSDRAWREICSTSRISLPARSGSRSISFQDDDGERVSQNVVEIAGNALALGHFGEMFNFFLSANQLAVGAISLREMDIAGTDHEREPTAKQQEPAAEM